VPVPARQPWRAASTVLFALLLGAVAGPLSWYAHDHMTGAARLAGDSAAAWLAIAFVAGRRSRSLIGGAVAGFLALGLTVATYYLAQASYGTWVESQRAVGYWQLVAALTGPVFGAAGAASRSAHPAVRGLAAAAMSAACCAEALIGYGGAFPGTMQTLYLYEGVIGLVVLVVLCREWRGLLAGAAWLPALAFAGGRLVSAFLHAQHDPGLPVTGYLSGWLGT
jgi:hypothetical protein